MYTVYFVHIVHIQYVVYLYNLLLYVYGVSNCTAIRSGLCVLPYTAAVRQGQDLLDKRDMHTGDIRDRGGLRKGA